MLLVVKNYTGDRINFGQAALIAQTEGIKVILMDRNDLVRGVATINAPLANALQTRRYVSVI